MPLLTIRKVSGRDGTLAPGACPSPRPAPPNRDSVFCFLFFFSRDMRRKMHSTVAAAVALFVIVDAALAASPRTPDESSDGRTWNLTAGVAVAHSTTCLAECIPEHTKLKHGKAECCSEGHETVECPGPAHYRCGPAAPPQGPGTQFWSFRTGNSVQSSPT